MSQPVSRASEVAANGPQSVAAPPAAATGAAGEDLPAGTPLAGPVPLPRHRPMQVAMAQGTMALGAIPLPRPRPADAPAATPSTPTNAPDAGYQPGMEPGHY